MLVVHFIIQLLYVSLSLLIFFCNHPRIETNYFNSSHYNMLVHRLFFFNGVMFIQPLFSFLLTKPQEKWQALLSVLEINSAFSKLFDNKSGKWE